MDNEVLEQLKQEYNEAAKRMQDLGEIIANCADIDTNHCGQDAESESQDMAPESVLELTGMQVVGAYPKGWKCKDCIFSEMKDSRCIKKVELVGGYYLCLAKIPNQSKPKD